MKKALKLEGKLCGNCANKIQDKISNIAGVNEAKVNFLTMRFTLDASDEQWDQIMEESVKIFNTIEPSCVVKRR